MNNYKKFEEKIEKSFAKSRENFSIPPNEYWVVLVDGKRVTVSSGKSLWKKKNHAGCAINLHVDNISSHLQGIAYNEQEYLKKTWIKEHTEVIALDEWRERGEP